MSTTRLGLTTPSGSDLVASGDNAISANATILDNAAIYKSGTYAARPAGNAVAAGTFYWATDVATIYVSDGTSWFTVNPADPVAGTAGLRTLGTGAQQAAAGNHNHDSAYAALSHTHSASAIVSGTISSARLPSALPGFAKVAGSSSTTELILYGRVAADGTRQAGSPIWTSSRLGTGQYRITYNMTLNPVVATVTCLSGSPGRVVATHNTPGSTSMDVYTASGDSGGQDLLFDFIIIGTN